MCGIIGIYKFKGRHDGDGRIKKMASALSHRGPDQEGEWINQDNTIALGHKRLSIIDHSNYGHQPMHSPDGRYTIVYNGEIYNYKELKEGLIKKGYVFTSQSDTEVLLALYIDKGVSCFHLLDGMFSFALWDDHEKKLICARDRFGEKPFFYFLSSEEFLFASEMKALFKGGVDSIVRKEMLLRFMYSSQSYSPNDRTATFYKNVFKLKPAHYIIVQDGRITEEKQYWVLKTTEQNISYEQAREKFIALFNESVSRRLRADVRIGSSLSGGLDSTSIVAKVSELYGQNASTFSACFNNYNKSEEKNIQLFLKKYQNVESHFVYPSLDGLLSNIDKILYHQEYPIEGPSIYAQYEVMKLAGDNQIRVLLDGQGADEVFGGYNHTYRNYLKALMKSDPKLYRTIKKKIIESGYVNRYSGRMPYFWMLPLGVYDRLRYIKRWFDYKFGPMTQLLTKDYLHYNNQIFFKDTEIVETDLRKHLHEMTVGPDLENLLRFADRNSMAKSLETRMPYLSHELIEFVDSLPVEYKINGLWSKFILRDSMKEKLPEEITWSRDKISFEAPWEQWMATPEFTKSFENSIQLLVENGVLDARKVEKQVHKKLNNGLVWNCWVLGRMFTVNLSS